MTKILSVAAITALCGLSATSMGAVLYTQAPHTPGAAGGNGLSTLEGFIGTSTPIYDREAADDFVVPAGPGWNVTRVSINAVQATVGDPNVVTSADIKFFNGAGAVVGSLVAAGVVGTTTRTTGPGTYFGRPEQVLTFDISSVILPAGTYFVQIQPIVNHNWFWLTSSPTTPISGSAAQVQRGVLTTAGNDATWPAAWQATGPGNVIFPTASDQAFTIEGTVAPAPGTIGLLALGGLAMGRRRR